MTLDLCIPAHNEATIILKTLELLHETLSARLDPNWMITVAENGSTDGTADIVRNANRPHVRVIEVKGKGKGLAIREAATASTAEIFGFIDADLSTDPAAIWTLFDAVTNGANLAISSRLMDVQRVHRGYWRGVSSRLFNLIAHHSLKIDVHDSQCGLKMMDAATRAILQTCTEPDWFLDLELLAKTRKRGLQILEIPVAWEEFRYPDRKSKLGLLKDAPKTVAALARIRRAVQEF